MRRSGRGDARRGGEGVVLLLLVVDTVPCNHHPRLHHNQAVGKAGFLLSRFAVKSTSKHE